MDHADPGGSGHGTVPVSAFRPFHGPAVHDKAPWGDQGKAGGSDRPGSKGP